MFTQDEDNLVGRPPQGREAEVQRRPQVLRHPVLRPAAGEVDHLLRWHPAEAGHWNQGVRDWLPGKRGGGQERAFFYGLRNVLVKPYKSSRNQPGRKKPAID